MFKALGALVGDAVKIVAAPVEVAAAVTRTVTAPLAEMAQDIAEGTKEALGQDDGRKA